MVLIPVVCQYLSDIHLIVKALPITRTAVQKRG